MPPMTLPYGLISTLLPGQDEETPYAELVGPMSGNGGRLIKIHFN